MSASVSRLVKVCHVACCVFLGSASGLLAGELMLQKVPPLTAEQAPAYPRNLARYYFGAQIEAAPQSNSIANLKLSFKSRDANIAEAALLCDDPTVGYALPSGRTTLLVSFPQIETIDSISFLNHGAKGDVKIAISSAKLPADSPQWHDVSKQALSSDAVKAKIGPTEAKYVKLTFNVADPGRIAALGIYSMPTISTFTMPRARKLGGEEKSKTFGLISCNLTDLHATARASYVSSGDDPAQANNMIDEQPATSYSFAANDAAPTAIVDLGKITNLRRLSAIYSPRHATVDFFVLKSLPGSGPANTSLPQTLRFDDNALAKLTPVGSVLDEGSGRAAIDFPEMSARYIMVKWTPATQQDTAFSVAEISAFGGTKGGSLAAWNASAAGAGEIASDYKAVQEGKDFKEAKEMPAEGPAEGPPVPLPQPPPFVFVPLVEVTSP